ncbi:MAG: tetratricopeptide repeat protein [Planctomycetota bacterium]
MSYPGPRSQRIKALFFLLVACLVMTVPALDGGVLGFDDIYLLNGPDGALEREPTSFFTGLFYYAYLPFYGLSLWFDGMVFSDAAFGMHLSNALWHAAAGYVLYSLLGRLLRSNGAALLGALVFCVHPIHVESVAWIAGRKEVLSGFFFFLSWLCHVEAEEHRRGARALSIACFLIACFTKASAVVLPALLLTAAAMLPRYQGKRKEALRAVGPMCIAALLPVIVHLAVGSAQGVIRGADPLGVRVVAGVYAWGSSVLRSLFPLGLSIDYPHVTSAGKAVWFLIPLLAAVFAGWRYRKKAPVAVFGIIAFFLCLAPFNNIFPATTVQTADRYLYLPLFGLAWLVAWGCREYPRCATATGFATLVLVGLSWHGSGRFASDEVLWTRTIETTDTSALAWVNRGLSRSQRALTVTPHDDDLLKEAVVDLESGFDRAHFEEHRAQAKAGLALAYLNLGDFAAARLAATDALFRVGDRNSPDARRFRARTLHHRGLAHRAVESFLSALDDFRASVALASKPNVQMDLGEMALRVGKIDEGLRAFEKAAGLDRKDPEPLLQTANVQRQLGHRNLCQRALDQAARRAPANPRVVRARMDFWLWGKFQDYAKARDELFRLPEKSRDRKILSATVDAHEARYLFRRRDTEKAIAKASDAVAGGIEDSTLLYDLGTVFLEGGRYDDAVKCFRRAGSVLRGRAAYQDAIARALTLKAHAFWTAGAIEIAARTMREALAVKPRLLEAGAAPLRGEIAALAGQKDDALIRLAIAAVVGDVALGEAEAKAILAGDVALEQRALTLQLRGLLRAHASFDLVGAQKDLEEAIGLDPKNPWTRYRKAQVLGRMGSAWLRTAHQIRSVKRRAEGEALLHRSKDILTQLLEENPEFHIARVERGAVYMALDRPGNTMALNAKVDFAHVSEKKVAIKEVYVKEAELHRLGFTRSGGYEKLAAGILLLEKALEYDPNYFDAMVEAGVIYAVRFQGADRSRKQRSLDFTRAIKWFRRAIAVNPRHTVPRREYSALTLAVARESSAAGDVKASYDLIMKSLEQTPDLKEALLELVRLVLSQGFRQKTGMEVGATLKIAEESLDKLERKHAGDPDVRRAWSEYHRTSGWLVYFAWIKEKPGKRRTALKQSVIERWRNAIEADPEDPDNAKIVDRVRELDPKQLELDSKRAQTEFELGSKAYQERRWVDAAKHFRWPVALFPTQSEFRFNLGMARSRAGEIQPAIDQLEQVAAGPRADSFPNAFFELGMLHSVLDATETSRAWYTRYIESVEANDPNPTDPAVRGRLKRAREMVQEKD